MKKLLLILTAMLLFSVMNVYAEKYEIPLLIEYTKETGECVVTNNSSKDYNNLVLYLDAYNEEGYKKEVKKEIVNLKEGEKVIFNLSELTDNPEKVDKLNLVEYSSANNDNNNCSITDTLATIMIFALIVLFFILLVRCLIELF